MPGKNNANYNFQFYTKRKVLYAHQTCTSMVFYDMLNLIKVIIIDRETLTRMFSFWEGQNKKSAGADDNMLAYKC